MARLWRAHHPDLPADPVGQTIELSREEAHHVLRVLRLSEGATLTLFDGQGREWSGSLAHAGSGRATVLVSEEVLSIVEPVVEVVLFQGLCRADRMDWLVQKATEVGVTEIRPLRCRRAEGRPPRIDRWQRIAVEACKQSGRRRVPSILVVDDLPDPAAPDRPALLLDPGAATGLGRLLERRRPEGVWLASGPESGFEETECASWVDRGWQAASLGPRTLRAETAGLVAATILLHGWGDLG